ncbi:MAG: hypothetical protein Q8N84_02875, partial [bacterium]|nr:hypothetical protein [bacterium]
MSEEEISALVGATGRTFRHSGEAIELFSAATEAERTQERLIATATLNNLMDKALRGDAGAERSLAALGFFADTIPSDIKKESLSRTSEKLREEVRQAQTEQQAAAENLRVVWSQSGDKLIQAAKEAEEERLAAVGLQPLVPSQEAGAAPPTLAEVASDLQAKREQLDLLEQAVGGKSEVLQELREKHGVNYQAWQKDQIEEYAEAVEKQVREAESRFNAMRAAQAGRERALQAEWGEQLQQLTEEARAVQGKAAELETLQGKIERHERVSPEEFRRLEVELAPGRKVEEAVAAEQVGVENELASVNARLEDLKAAGPTSGQALAEKVAGVEVAPRVAPKDLSQPEFNWEVLGGMETGERMLTVQESQVRLREELAQLNKLAAGDEEAGQYWQEKGAPAVWKREDMEAATTSREEILRQLETRGKEWLPEYEQWRKGAVESYQEALFDKELGAKEPGALLGKLDAPSEKQAIRRAEETYLQAKEDVALMEAVDSTQDKLTQGGVPADLRAAPRGVGDSAAPEFVQAKADLGDWEKKSKSEQAFKVFTTEARMREEMDLLSRAVGGDEESRLELQRRGAPVAWKPEEMATALKNREETYRQLEPKMEPLKKDFEKWAAGVQHRYESLQGYANQPDLLTQVYNLPLEEAEKKHTEVLAQAQADIKTVRQFHQADYTLRHYNRPLDLQAPERWAGVAMTETEAVMPYAQPERLEEVASAYLRDDQRRQGGWEVREQWQKELHREMGRKEAGIAGLKEEIAETEKQLGLVSGKAAEQLQKHGQALERKVKAVETEINNLRGIERVGLVDEHGKSLAAGSGGGAAGRVKSDLVGYGLVDEKGQWNKEIFGATPEKAAAVGERVRQAEASVSRNLYVDAANRSIGSWERETVKKALGGAVDSRKKEWISRSGLLGEEREKYASSFHDNVTTLKKSGLSETQAFRRALGEVKADSLRDSAGFKEHRDWILNQVDPKDRQAVAAKLDAALNNLPRAGLAKAGFTGDYQVQLLTGQAQAGEAPEVVLKIGASR